MDARLKKLNVATLRTVAKSVGVKPIPSKKADIIAAIAKFPDKKIQSAIAASESTEAPKKKKAIPGCGGRGVTKESLLAYLREQDAVSEYSGNGMFLSMAALRKICRELYEEKEREIQEEKEEVFKDMNEYQKLIKEEDPSLFAAVKDIISFVPDPRALLTQRVIRVDWVPWKSLYEEINALFDVIGEGGRSPELAVVLDYVQNEAQTETFGIKPEDKPDKKIVQYFEELFPVLTYVYAHKDLRFRWLLAEYGIERPFSLARLVTEPRARIPYLLRPSDYYSVYSSGWEIPADLSRLVRLVHKLSIFLYNDEEHLIDVIANNKKMLEEYLNNVQKDTDPEWVDVAVYIARHLRSREAIYEVAQKVLELDLTIPEELREIAEQRPVPKTIEDVRTLSDVNYAILAGIPEKVEHLVDAYIARGKAYDLVDIFSAALRANSRPLVTKILSSGILHRKSVYLRALTSSLENNLKILKVSGFDAEKDIGTIVLYVAQQVDIPYRSNQLDHLEELLRKYVDPTNPPNEIAEVFRLAERDIARMTRVETQGRYSGPPPGWGSESQIKFLKLMVEYGARTDEQYLGYIKRALRDPNMQPFVRFLLDRGVRIPIDSLGKTSDIAYALERVHYSQEERLDLLLTADWWKNEQWVIEEIETNPLVTDEVASRLLRESRYLNHALLETIAKKNPRLTDEDITEYIKKHSFNSLAMLFSVFNLYGRKFKLEPPVDGESSGTALTWVLTQEQQRTDYQAGVKFINFLNSLLEEGTKPDRLTLFLFLRYVQLNNERQPYKPRKKKDIERVFNNRSDLEIQQQKFLEKLLQAGSDPNEIVEGETPLVTLLSASLSKPTLQSASIGLAPVQQIALLDTLIKGGAEVNNNKGKTTALIAAVRKRNTVAVQALIDHGADLEAVDKSGKKAIVYAINKKNKKNKEIVELLKKAGASLKSYTHKKTVIDPQALMRAWM